MRRRTLIPITAILIFVVVLSASIWFLIDGLVCTSTVDTSHDPDQNRSATEENAQQRLVWAHRSSALSEISIGMHKSEVVHLLGHPTQEHPLHEAFLIGGKRIGTTLFYLREPGTGIGKGGEEIRIYFNLQGQVMRIWDNLGGVEHFRGQLPSRDEGRRDEGRST